MSDLTRSSPADDRFAAGGSAAVAGTESRSDMPTIPADHAAGTRPSGSPAPADRPPFDPPPGFVGEQVLGEGGMGVVYLARQIGLNRPVALKTLKPGVEPDAKGLIRFLAEAEAVAAVRHPNVVEVFQYGDHNGRPYLALEYCPGGELTALRRTRPPDDAGWFARAAGVMAAVADGVQAAHAVGIVHRDLKPPNVLLAADGTPKVTDFGLAKRGMGADLTRTDTILGTPAYMSPEQAGGGTKYVGPESDVWALGVMLYELLAGRRPFDAPSPVEMVAKVLSGEVPPLRSVCPQVPPDLGLIVQKCLKADPRERYPTAGGLAADLRNWLTGKPISARPVGAVEAVAKWARRNPRAAWAVAGVAAVLVLATWFSSWQAVRATREARRAAEAYEKILQQEEENRASERKAAEEKTRAELEAKGNAELSAFLKGTFNAADPTGFIGAGLLPAGQGGAKVTVAELLDRAEARLRDQKSQSADRTTRLTRATLLDAVGEALRSIGRLDRAGPLLKEAVATRRELLPPDHPDLLDAEFHLANWLTEAGDLIEADAAYVALLDAHKRNGTLETLPAAFVQLRLSVLRVATFGEDAEALARAAVATRSKLLGGNHRETAAARLMVVSSLFSYGKAGEGVGELKSVLAAFTQLDADPTISAALDYAFGVFLANTGAHAAAVERHRSGIQKLRAALGDHLYLSLFYGDLAVSLRANNQPAEAEKAFKECLDILRRTAGIEYPMAGVAVEGYADLLIDRGQADDAWAVADELYKASTKRYGPNAPWRSQMLNVVARVAVRSGRTRQADELVGELLEAFRSRPADRRLRDAHELSKTAQRFDHLPGLTAYRKIYKVLFELPERQADTHCRCVDHGNFGQALLRHGLDAEGEPYLREGVRLMAEPALQSAANYPGIASAQTNLALLEWRAGRPAEAEKLLRAAVGYNGKLPRDRRRTTEPVLLVTALARRGDLSDLIAPLDQLSSIPGLTPAVKAWAASLRVATAPPGADVREWAEEADKAFGKSDDPAVAVYRARTAVAGGGDVRRELDRLNGLIREKQATGVCLARAACALALDRPADAVEAVAHCRPQPDGSPRGQLVRAVGALAAHRQNKTDDSKAALQAEAAAAEKFLTAAGGKGDLSLPLEHVADLVELHRWLKGVRAEVK